jgi:diaminopimelate epimerase
MLEFTKMHGLGNDYVVINAMEGAPAGSLNTLAKRLCDRHFGVGADGLILVMPSTKADFRMRIFNSDGSEAEMCGNGIRCFSKYIYDHSLTRSTDFEVETKAGIIKPHLIVKEEKATIIKVDMGEPRLASDEIPMTGSSRPKVVKEPLLVLGKKYEITCVSMGNPHCVIFWDKLDNLPIETLGPAIECHEVFPKRTNVEFAHILSPTAIGMRVWERGVGETLACGTGSAATLVAAVLNGKASRRATLHLLGGNLQVEWNEKTNHAFIAGPAKEVFKGKALI